MLPVCFILYSSHIFGTSKVRHFKFRSLIDTQEYQPTHDILHPKGMCNMSCDLFKFREISDNISLAVQDRDMVAMEH